MNGVSLPETVVASYASLSGQLQSSLGDLGPSLTELDLEGNSMITGSVPTEAGLLGGLEILNLKLHSLNGVLPTEVGALTSLQTWTCAATPSTAPYRPSSAPSRTWSTWTSVATS